MKEIKMEAVETLQENGDNGNDNSDTFVKQPEGESIEVQSIQSVKTDSSLSPIQLLAIAIQSGYDKERLQMVKELYEWWQAKEAEKAWNKAMAEFKKNPPKVIRDMHRKIITKTGAKIEYDHVSIGNLVLSTVPFLAEHGFNTKWKTTKDEANWIEMTCHLTHKEGHTESSSMGGPPDQSGNKNMIQARASTKSYLKRYTFEDVTGLATNENEDDGKGGAENPGGNNDNYKTGQTGNQQQLNKLKGEAHKLIRQLHDGKKLDDKKFEDSIKWITNTKDIKTLQMGITKLKKNSNGNGTSPSTEENFKRQWMEQDVEHIKKKFDELSDRIPKFNWSSYTKTKNMKPEIEFDKLNKTKQVEVLWDLKGFVKN